MPIGGVTRDMPPERPNIPDYYAVLGIGFNATHEEVRAAWREAVKRWHPDRNNSAAAAERMREVNDAWDVLGKPESRATYNRNYFILQAAIAEAEREEHEKERLRAERHEEIRRQDAARRRREEAAARARHEEAERRRREEERERRERATRAAREREARARAEARRRAEMAERDAEIQRKRREKERRAEIRRERRAAGLVGNPMVPVAFGGVVVVAAVGVVLAATILAGAFGSSEPPSPNVIVVTRVTTATPTVGLAATRNPPTPAPSASPRPSNDRAETWLPWPDATQVAQSTVLIDHHDCADLDHPVPFRSVSITVATGEIGLRILAEFMSTPSERAQGSQCRPHIADGVGFLYEYGGDQTHAFWAFNTYQPLDVIYLSGDKRYAGATTMTPCPRPVGANYADWRSKCSREQLRYLPEKPYQWALELRSGWIPDVTGLPLAEALEGAVFKW